MDRSAQWATRIRHEAQFHETTCFLTLTFNDTNLPDDYSVNVRDLQLFNKRLRKALGPFRFFACGEYGEINLRPHYHMILFGHDFATTRRPWRQTATGFVTYRSSILEKIWTAGHSEIGTVTTQSAGYVARYCLKKVTGDPAAEHYTRIHPITGEICQVKPEFICMSSKPGIGRQWIEQYKGDVYPSDFITLDGEKRSVPRYYKNQLSEEEQERVGWKRRQAAIPHRDNNTPDRLQVREELQTIRASRLKRTLENDD